jgi:hypothetical protein
MLKLITTALTIVQVSVQSYSYSKCTSYKFLHIKQGSYHAAWYGGGGRGGGGGLGGGDGGGEEGER